MKRLLLTLLAAIALPTAVNAEEFTEIKPKNIYSYKKSSLVKYENDGKRYIGFLGTTLYRPCFNGEVFCIGYKFKTMEKKVYSESIQDLIWSYELDCDDGTFNRSSDELPWKNIWMDPTAKNVALKYCPMEEWSKLPNK